MPAPPASTPSSASRRRRRRQNAGVPSGAPDAAGVSALTVASSNPEGVPTPLPPLAAPVPAAPVRADSQWVWSPSWSVGPAGPLTAPITVDAVNAMLRETEARTMRAFSDLRDEVRSANTRYMPTERVQDRWQQDQTLHAQQAQQFIALQAAVSHVEQVLPTLATKDDFARLVADRLAEFTREHPTTLQVEHAVASAIETELQRRGYATATDVQNAIGSRSRTTRNELLKVCGVIIATLTFLSAAGIIHPLLLFTGGR